MDKHFTPTYQPWDQRVCLIPDGDFFQAIKFGKPDVATGHVRSFTENGIELGPCPVIATRETRPSVCTSTPFPTSGSSNQTCSSAVWTSSLRGAPFASHRLQETMGWIIIPTSQGATFMYDATGHGMTISVDGYSTF